MKMKHTNESIMYYKGKRIDLVFEDYNMIVSPPDRVALQSIQQQVQHLKQEKDEEVSTHLDVSTVIEDEGNSNGPDAIKLGDIIGGDEESGITYKVQKNDIFVWYPDERCYVKVIVGKEGTETVDKNHITILQARGIIDNKYNVLRNKVNTVFSVEKNENGWQYTVVGYDGFATEINKLLPVTPQTVREGMSINGEVVNNNDIVIYQAADKEKGYVIRHVSGEGRLTMKNWLEGLKELKAISEDGKLLPKSQVYKYHEAVSEEEAR